MDFIVFYAGFTYKNTIFFNIFEFSPKYLGMGNFFFLLQTLVYYSPYIIWNDYIPIFVNTSFKKKVICCCESQYIETSYQFFITFSVFELFLQIFVFFSLVQFVVFYKK